MNDRPQRIFLDTNVYIIGAAIPDSDEAAILDWASFDGSEVPEIEDELALDVARAGEAGMGAPGKLVQQEKEWEQQSRGVHFRQWTGRLPLAPFFFVAARRLFQTAVVGPV